MKPTTNTIEVYHSSAVTAGYGHKKITVELRFGNEYKKFNSTTTNMPAYDESTELEGQQKNEALYAIIENSISDEVAEWIDTLN